jgi:hypothetical protein
MAELGVHQSVLLTYLALCVNRWRLFSPGWYRQTAPGASRRGYHGAHPCGLFIDVFGVIPVCKLRRGLCRHRIELN